MRTSRAADSSPSRKSDRYSRTGASTSTRARSTSLIIAVATVVFEIEAIGKTVSPLTGWGLSRFVRPKPRTIAAPFLDRPNATPGILYSAILAAMNRPISAKRGSSCWVASRSNASRIAGRAVPRAGRAAPSAAAPVRPMNCLLRMEPTRLGSRGGAAHANQHPPSSNRVARTYTEPQARGRERCSMEIQGLQVHPCSSGEDGGGRSTR